MSREETAPLSTPPPAPPRWRLNRAGIVNVYQYENEVLTFGGGRLLLRGVNGSGKSTAMNMLLPFLITAHQRGIDAAGEQSAVLRSWMLSGRDEAQPIGYLWLELARPAAEADADSTADADPTADPATDHLTIGCGIKANRASGNVTTWWFLTNQRPGIDFSLIERRVPLSIDALRTTIGRDAVHPHDRRPDYRQAVRRRLFGGAELDQHLSLLNTVRSPRVGDRVDVDLPEHLVNALPALSESALDQAARPLEDLDEHRTNVAALEATVTALTGIADTYRRYTLAELHRRLDDGRQRLTQARRHTNDEARHTRAAHTADEQVTAAAAEIERLEARANALDTEIEALRQSDAYTEGQQLEELRDRVTSLHRQVTESERRRAATFDRLAQGTTAVVRAEASADHDLADLTTTLGQLSALAATVHLSARPPAPPTIDRTALPPPPPGATPAVDGDPTPAEPARPDPIPDVEPLERALAATSGATQVRAGEISDVRRHNGAVDDALATLVRTEADLDRANDNADEATTTFETARVALDQARTGWDATVTGWAQRLADHHSTNPLPSPTTTPAPANPDHPIPTVSVLAASGLAGLTTNQPEAGADIDRPTIRSHLEHEARALLTLRMGARAEAEQATNQARSGRDEAAARVDELARRTEPDPPSLPWQQRHTHCLADLVDFAPHLDPTERAGLEAALEASGLLMATVEGGALRLQSGDLVAIPSQEAPAPLSHLLTVSAPDGEGIDEGLVAKLLDTISTDLASPATTVVATDGRFRLGALEGRHTKPEAEAVGVSARRAALERLRTEAATALAEAEATLAAANDALDRADTLQGQASTLVDQLPSLTPVTLAQDRADLAEAHLAQAREAVTTAREARAEAERVHATRAEERDRVARTHQLPTDPEGLDEVDRSLHEINALVDRSGDKLNHTWRSLAHWHDSVERWLGLVAEAEEATAAHTRLEAEHLERAAKLATLEDSLGLPYQEILATIDTATTERTTIRQQIPTARHSQQDAIEDRAKAQAAAGEAARRRTEADDACTTGARTLHRALAVPGLLAAAGVPEPPPELAAIISSEPPQGPAGLTTTTETLAAVLPPAEDGEATAEGVRISLRRRRDALGAGWDAEDRQPDPTLPLEIQVNGPHGRLPLAQALTSTADSLATLSALLTEKQDQALRELLQGLVAREVAEKLDGATTLIAGMNRRLTDVTTAHGIGVELRWRRSGGLDDGTTRMVDLLSKLPDLRTPDEDAELSETLSVRLGDARAVHPDLPYRTLIADVLDYRQWYDLDVLVRREGQPPAKLTRRTPLSEGEKKLVTYLPLFAAVAASCDALAAYAPEVPRFVLLDDAFAKVSEDNHAALFGLLVELDLDLIATSERLWGTHATVPELAITEVIRDAELGAILLEHARWDGHTLTRGPSTAPPPR